MNIYNIWIMIQGKVAGLFKPTETAYDAEFAKKRIDELYMERLHHEAMAFRYYRAMTSNSKGLRRQAAKIKRLEAHISDIEFINKYLEGGSKEAISLYHEVGASTVGSVITEFSGHIPAHIAAHPDISCNGVTRNEMEWKSIAFALSREVITLRAAAFKEVI